MRVVLQTNSKKHVALKKLSFGNNNFCVEDFLSIKNMSHGVFFKMVHGEISCKVHHW